MFRNVESIFMESHQQAMLNVSHISEEIKQDIFQQFEMVNINLKAKVA